MQLTAIVNDKPSDRLRAPDLDLLSGGELLPTVADAIVVGAPVLVSSLDVCTGYKRDASVCVPLVGWTVDEEAATFNAIVDVKNAVIEDEKDDTCIDPGSLRGLKPAS